MADTTDRSEPDTTTLQRCAHCGFDDELVDGVHCLLCSQTAKVAS